MNAPWEWIDAFLDDELTPAQETELREWLTADREHVRAFVRATHLHRSLPTELLAQKVLHLEGAPGRNVSGGLGSATAPGASPTTPGCSSTRDRVVQPDASGPTGEGAGRNKVVWSPVPTALFMRRRGAILALAASLALLVGLRVWLFPPVDNEPVLTVATGTRVTLERDGRSFPAQDGLKLLPGDLLRISGSNGAAIGYAKEDTRAALKDATELKILSWQKGKNIELRRGKLEAVVARQRPWKPMVLVTVQAEARVLGTKFTLATAANSTRLEVTEGKVKLTRTQDGSAVKVGAGQYAVAATNYELAAQPLTGGIFREYWTNLAGGALAYLITHPNYPDRPDGWSDLTNLSQLEMPSNWGDNFGVRLRGYIHIPKTGDYTFWIAAMDDASLWLSPDEDPENKIHMAHSEDTASQDWQSDAAQQSATVPFTAGRRYYFEVLHKAAVGDDHLAVAWRRPGGVREVIPGQYLSPFETKPKPKEKKR